MRLLLQQATVEPKPAAQRNKVRQCQTKFRHVDVQQKPDREPHQQNVKRQHGQSQRHRRPRVILLLIARHTARQREAFLNIGRPPASGHKPQPQLVPPAPRVQTVLPQLPVHMKIGKKRIPALQGFSHTINTGLVIQLMLIGAKHPIP
ncbi:hypothetical protein PHACT_05710 [Pseudohongiella acticola]|uniref:Uncharacterized protein n=1 Tax=Pseudohongiella acticola TaxID=1524254 RepID=A0A1E8CJW9_9GAMM|nr:hypothetical protein PHACT_05710 [Pseudohongiella acticola]